MRFLSQASLISQATIINIVSTTTGAANVASIVSIFAASRATILGNLYALGLFQN
jgi:K+-transporting ATPase A subunit